MKQIKVYITPEQWAEKRLQMMPVYPTIDTVENIDRKLILCGYELKTPETEPQQPQPVEPPTDKVEAVRYFLNQLPSGYRERALAQVNEDRVKSRRKAKSILEALMSFAEWTKTCEGDTFWNEVDNYYFRIKRFSLPPLPND